MTVEEAARKVYDTIREEVIQRFGESLFERVVAGHLLTDSANWFAPYLAGEPAGRAGSRGEAPGCNANGLGRGAPWRGAGKSAAKRIPPLSPLAELEEVAGFFKRELRRPALEVQCGLGYLSACLGFELSIDRSAQRVEIARRAFPDVKIECRGVEEVQGDGAYAAVLTAFGLGCADSTRGNPIFLEFATHADRLLRPGGRVLIAERARFQDNVLEPLVGLEYEIVDLAEVKGSNSVLILAEKP